MNTAPFIENIGAPRATNIDGYRQERIDMLQIDSCITLTDEELERVNSLKTEAQIDQFYLGILNNRWG